MSFPDIPAGMGIPLVTLADGLLPDDTMDALDARYPSGAAALPSGGTAGQVLTKDSGTDYDTSWQAVEGLPVGGTLGQVLTKQSGTDGDADWETPASPDDHVTPMLPAVGQYIRPGLSTGNASISNQLMTLVPIMVYADVTVDAFLLAAATTNGTTHDVGLYPSHADGTPDFSAGPLRSASFTFATANPTVTVTPIALTRGLYWGAFRSGGTGPSVRKMVGSAPPLPFIPAGLGMNGVGYLDSGVVSLPSGAFTPTLDATWTGLVCIMLRISAV